MIARAADNAPKDKYNGVAAKEFFLERIRSRTIVGLKGEL